MRTGKGSVRTVLLWLTAALFIGLATSSGAIDNPDAPNRVAEFEKRALPFEKALSATDGGSASARAGQAYARFLDAELNAAYGGLLSKLDNSTRSALVESQRQWLRFRNAEAQFIGRHWTRERSGTSSSLSVAGYSNAVVKDRVLQLLRYTSEYP